MGVRSPSGPLLESPVDDLRARYSQAHAKLKAYKTHLLKAAESAPNKLYAEALLHRSHFDQVGHCRGHCLPEFDWDASFGVGGIELRECIERYTMEQHRVAKASANGVDVFMHGTAMAGVLLHWGDIAAARAGWMKVTSSWQQAEASVRQGASSWNAFLVEALEGQTNLLPTMMAAGELRLARELFRHSFGGNALRDSSVRASWERCIRTTPFFAWQTEDGYRCASYESWLLQTRALKTVLDDEVNDDGTGIDWLPPPSELLRIAKLESWWDIYLTGAAHPALLCACLHARLGAWGAAQEVAEGLLQLTSFNRLVRAEAFRLLSRCHGASGRSEEACDALDSAASEAAKAGYAWMEMVATADKLSFEGVASTEVVRARVRELAGQLRASPNELVTVLGHERLAEIWGERHGYS